VERRLALMAGAGEIPGQVAAAARQQGWRVVAFAAGDPDPGLAEQADEVIAVSMSDIQAALAPLSARAPSAAVFCGTFSKREAFARAAETDQLGRRLIDRGLGDIPLRQMIVSVLGTMGIEVLDQRRFVGPWLMTAPALTDRSPSAAEWNEVRAGLAVARALAGLDVGQTVVQARGVTVAVEAMEGTDEAIRRGTRLAGPGAVIVKAIGPGNDYRFDVPAVGLSTLAAAAEGKAAVIALERGRIMLVRRDEVARRAREAGIAVVSVDADG
jgi:DUF1009 family protein